MADIPVYPLYNRTYLLYRVSPLHTGNAPLLSESALRAHAQRLTSQLKGDNIRGVQVDYGGTEGAIAKLGPLERCSWDVVGDEEDWINRHRHLLDIDASEVSASSPPENARGVQVTLEYERTVYNALLLRDPGMTSSPEGFTSLPLLMLKMPAPVRGIFLHYLETAFDAHVAPLRLPSAFLTSTLETYFRHLSASDATQSIQDVIRQLQLRLSFPGATSLLTHIDVAISSNDVPGFVQRGKLLKDSTPAPFTSAISAYLRKHLALDLSNPQVIISQIACTGFTLNTDRLKLSALEVPDVSIIDDETPDGSPSQLAVQDFYASLVREATGTGRFLVSEDGVVTERASASPSSDGTPKAGVRRKRAVSRTASSSAQAKKSKARGKENNRAAQDVDMRDA